MGYRRTVTEEVIERQLENLGKALRSALDTKGPGAFHSSHEAFGVLIEEVDEMKEALRAGDAEGFANEAMDVAIAALFTVASIQSHYEADSDLRPFFSR